MSGFVPGLHLFISKQFNPKTDICLFQLQHNFIGTKFFELMLVVFDN